MLTQVFALVLYATNPTGPVVQPIATFPDKGVCVLNGTAQAKAARKVGFTKVKTVCIEEVVVESDAASYPGPAGVTGAQGPAGPAGAQGPAGPAGEGCAEHCKKAKPGKRCYN